MLGERRVRVRRYWLVKCDYLDNCIGVPILIRNDLVLRAA